MNYKKIFRSRKFRYRVLKALSFVPDKPMLMVQYWIKFGRWPNLKSPTRYTEKIQLYKMHYRNPDVIVCCDKYAVRDYLASRGMGSLLPKLYGVYDRAEDIDFTSLPDKFVMKTNDGGGGNNVKICKDKRSLDIQATIKELNSWLDTKEINPGREWGYTGIQKSVIIIEEYLEDKSRPGENIDDFKFFCFNGEIFCVQHDMGRFTEAHTRTFYDENWNDLHVTMTVKNSETPVAIPENFEEMKNVARRLAKEFPHVRVDLYSVNGKIYFGELTFYNASGYNYVDPDEFDITMGQQFDLSTFISPSSPYARHRQ